MSTVRLTAGACGTDSTPYELGLTDNDFSACTKYGGRSRTPRVWLVEDGEPAGQVLLFDARHTEPPTTPGRAYRRSASTGFGIE